MNEKKLAGELRRIQQELRVPKAQVNNFGKYKYRSCENILEAVKPLLGECLLILDDELLMIGDRYYIKSTAKLSFMGDCITTTSFAREEETKKGMDGCQITGASASYARKYALNCLFLIDDTKDSDCTNTGKNEKESEFINPEKAIELFVKLKPNGKSSQQLKDYLLTTFKITSSKEIKKTDISKIMQWIKTPVSIALPDVIDLEEIL